jgi:CBS domain-containing protein
VATEMMEHWARHALVEEDGRLVGIVSARDLLGAYAAADADPTGEDED